MKPEQSTLGTGAWFVWASNRTDAIRQVASVTNTPKAVWKVGNAGLTRPASYDYEGNEADGYREIFGQSLLRYSVRKIK